MEPTDKPIRFEMTNELEPVGLDYDNVYKPIDELQYRPPPDEKEKSS